MWRQYLQFTCTKEFFSEADPESFSSKGRPANMQQIYRRKPIWKCNFTKSCVALLHGCSTVNLLRICITPFYKNTSRGLVLFFISFVLMQVINNTFYWLAFILSTSEFVDWSKTFWRLSLFYDVFIEFFPNACCTWSTYYIFVSIFSQTKVRCNCRSSPPQVFFKKDRLIYTCYKCEEE